METMDVLHWLSQYHIIGPQDFSTAIIPTVFIPLTALTVALTSLAGMIAGWFGVKLNTEGPKQFLEVLLKKRVLISMLIMNVIFWSIYKAYIYVYTLPSFISTIERESKSNAIVSNQNYPDSLFRQHNYYSDKKSSEITSLKLEQEIKIPKGSFRSGVISGNSIFYGSDDGYIYEINKENLSTIRKFFIGTAITTRPVIYQNRIYAGEGTHDTHHARIYSFDLHSGKFISAFKTKGHTEGQPLIEHFNGKTLMFITAGSDGLYAIDPLTMKEVWHKKDGHMDATVSVQDGVVYAGTGVEKGTVGDRSYGLAYEFDSGKIIWKKELPLSNWMHPVITDHDVCFSLGEIYIKSSVGLIHCANKKDGTPHFSIPFDAPLTSKPLYIKDHAHETIFVSGINGFVCAVDVGSKEKLWCQSTSEKVISKSMSSFEYDTVRGVLWYPTLDNGLYAMEPRTGKVLTHWEPDQSHHNWKESYGAMNVNDDNLYHLDIDGNVRKFKIN